MPLWAFRQTELLGYVKRFVEFYIDHRQSDFGDFGGGISDDVDLLNTWPGVALMGSDPEKLKLSLHRLLEAAVKNGMFTNGLPTIQADELHSYEEGINNLAANMILDFGNPRQIERAMVTARGVESITGINAAGHRHIMTSYYSGTKMATDEPWGCFETLFLSRAAAAAASRRFQRQPRRQEIPARTGRRLSGPRPHGKRPLQPGQWPFVSSTTRGTPTPPAAFSRGTSSGAPGKWTGDRKYLTTLLDGGPQSARAVNANTLDLLDLRAQMSAARGTAGGGGNGRAARAP